MYSMNAIEASLEDLTQEFFMKEKELPRGTAELLVKELAKKFPNGVVAAV